MFTAGGPVEHATVLARPFRTVGRSLDTAAAEGHLHRSLRAILTLILWNYDGQEVAGGVAYGNEDP